MRALGITDFGDMNGPTPGAVGETAGGGGVISQAISSAQA